MGMMAAEDDNTTTCSTNYSFFQANIILPRVTSLSRISPDPIIKTISSETDEENNADVGGGFLPSPKMSNKPLKPDLDLFTASNHKYEDDGFLKSLDNSPLQNIQKTKGKKMKNKVKPCEDDLTTHSDNLFIPRSHLLPKLSPPKQLQPMLLESINNTQLQNENEQTLTNNNKKDTNLTECAYPVSLENNKLGKEDKKKSNEISSTITASQENIFKTAQNDLGNPDKDLVNMYKDYLDKCNKDFDNTGNDSSDSDVSVSSLSESDDSCDGADENTLVSGTFEPLYSLPHKDKGKKLIKRDLSGSFNKIVISNSKTSPSSDSLELYQNGSLPDLHSLNKCRIQKVSHVMKNDSEPESEPGAQIRYKVRPLPPIPGVSSNLDKTNLYETLDKFSKHDVVSHAGNEKKTFKQIATLLTLVPRVPTKQARSRKDDHQLSDILQYLPDRKLKIFIGTWNMKGTKYLPESLDDFLLPPESVYLQDVYVIGTQEGTPFRHEWQLKLQETFGPSHVLVQASNFGVLQLSIFVRRELVWFCSNVDQDTTATRVGHKIKTKGALAMSFSIFGTSFLFITSHFTSHEGRLRDRINDYNSICQNLQLPPREASDVDDCKDVTNRFDRVFWFGDFNFRVRKARNIVDKLIDQHRGNEKYIISELLAYDQLHDVRGKIFHGFSEAPIHFMPTYKFDVHTNNYDTSTKQRVPSWTDRVLYKSIVKGDLEALCYNSCDTIKNSDHRPVYAILETLIEPYKSKFVVTGAQFDRDIYVEANMRRSAPGGSQDQSHVCTIL